MSCVHGITDKPLEKHRRKFDEASAAMAAAVTEAGVRAAVEVVRADTDMADMPARATVKQAAVARRVLDQGGHMAAGVLRSVLPGVEPAAFDAAVYTLAKLLLTSVTAGSRP